MGAAWRDVARGRRRPVLEMVRGVRALHGGVLHARELRAGQRTRSARGLTAYNHTSTPRRTSTADHHDATYADRLASGARARGGITVCAEASSAWGRAPMARLGLLQQLPAPTRPESVRIISSSWSRDALGGGRRRSVRSRAPVPPPHHDAGARRALSPAGSRFRRGAALAHRRCQSVFLGDRLLTTPNPTARRCSLFDRLGMHLQSPAYESSDRVRARCAFEDHGSPARAASPSGVDLSSNGLPGARQHPRIKER